MRNGMDADTSIRHTSLRHTSFRRSLRRVAPLAALSVVIAACSGADGGRSAARDAASPTPLASGSGDGSIRLVADQPPDVMNAALALQQVFRDVARASVPTVVQIDTMQTRQRFGTSFEQPSGTGSGVIYDRTGNTYFVLTNAHVIQNTDSILLTLHDGTEISEGVRLVGADSKRDIAVLRFNSREPLAVATLGDSDALQVGDQVLAVGSPFGFQSTVTSGIISAVHREQRQNPWAEYIQTDASINPGNSGGSLVALDGSVVAINTWIASRTGISAGIGFALPINTALLIADQLRGGGVRYGYLGVQLQPAGDVGQWSDGALVTSVYTRSPAERAGFLAGDVIIAVDGQSVTGTGEVMRNVGDAGPGTRLTLTVERDGTEQEITVRLAERPQEGEPRGTNWPGIFVLDDPPGQGIGVHGVSDTSAAWLTGLRRGDVIIEIDGRKVSDVDDFYAALREADTAELTVLRPGSGRSRTVTMTIDR